METIWMRMYSEWNSQYGEVSFAMTKDLNLKTVSEGERRESRRGHTYCVW